MNFRPSHRAKTTLALAVGVSALVFALPQAVSAASPATLTFVSPTSSTISGRVSWQVSSPVAVTRVTFSIDGGPVLWTEWVAPYFFGGDGKTLDATTLSDGQHTLTAVGLNALGGVIAVGSATVMVNNALPPPPPPSLPTLTFVSPTSTTVSGSVSWEVSSPTPVNHVNFSIDGGPVAWVEWFAPYFFKGDARMWDTTALSDGQHTLTAVGVDSTGAVVATGSRTITVANAAPPPPPPATNLGGALPARMPESTGNEYYVDGTNGSDWNPGTRSAPWRSINKALASVQLSGSIINVRAGAYVGQVAYNGRNADPSNPITLRAYPGEHVLLTAPPSSLFNAIWVYNGGGIRIRGFEITGPTSNNGIRVENSHDVEVTNCDIHDNGHMGMQVVGTGSGSNRNIQLWSSRLHHNGGAWVSLDPYWLRGDHDIYWGAVSSDYDGVDHTAYGGVVADNVFYDQPYGRELQIGSQVSGLIVTNNSFHGAAQPDPRAGTAIAFYGEGTAHDPRNVVVVNNIIASNAHKGVYGSGGYDPVMRTNVVRNNLAWDNPDGDFDNTYDSATLILFQLGTNFTGKDPLLVDPTSGNMQLGAGSPAIGKADPVYAPPADFYGKPRPATPDLGAVEN